MNKLITILLLTLAFNAQAELSSYVTGCAAGGATRDRPIEIWQPYEINHGCLGTDENKTNMEFVQGYYDCRYHPEILVRIEKGKLFDSTSNDINKTIKREVIQLKDNDIVRN